VACHAAGPAWRTPGCPAFTGPIWEVIASSGLREGAAPTAPRQDEDDGAAARHVNNLTLIFVYDMLFQAS
jgi:hypothetical protein